MTAWLAGVLLVIPVDSRAAPPSEPAPAVPQVEATPEDLPPRETQPARAKKTGFGRMIAGAAIGFFSVPAVVSSTILLADMPNEATAGIWGITTVVMVTGAALLGTGANRYQYSPCGDSRREKTGVGMIVSGTALLSLGASSVIIGGLGGGLGGSGPDPFYGSFLGVGSLSAASGVALLVAGSVRRKHRPCLACTRLSPLVSFDPRGGHVGIALRF